MRSAGSLEVLKPGRRRHWLAVALAAIVLVLGSVAVMWGADPPGRAPSDDALATRADADAWTALQERIYRAGGPTPALALEAFATVFGPVPGVPIGEIQLPEGMSGTGAIRLVLRFWDAYTSEQRRAIRALIQPEAAAPPPGLRGPNSIRVVGSSIRSPIPPRQAVQAISDQQQAEQIAADMARRIGRALRVPIVVTLEHPEMVLHPPGRAAGYAFAARYAGERVYVDDETWIERERWYQQPANEPMDTCMIVITPSGSVRTGTDRRALLAHEVYHCFQHDLLNNSWPRPDSWLIEGAAEWAAQEYVGDAWRSQFWRAYLGQKRPLFARSYDAIGFFAHLDSVVANLWTLLDELHRLGRHSSVIAFQEAVDTAGRTKFLETWPMSLARRPEWGSAWDVVGPGVPPDVVRGSLDVGVGVDAPAHLTMEPVDQRLFWLRVNLGPAPVPDGLMLSLNVRGHGAIAWPRPNETTRTDLIGGSFAGQYCVSGTCTCPDGQRPAGLMELPATTPYIALTGDTGTAELRAELSSSRRACASSAPTAEPPPLACGTVAAPESHQLPPGTPRRLRVVISRGLVDLATPDREDACEDAVRVVRVLLDMTNDELRDRLPAIERRGTSGNFNVHLRLDYTPHPNPGWVCTDLDPRTQTNLYPGSVANCQTAPEVGRWIDIYPADP